VRLKIASCLFAGALVLAACGGDDDDATEASGGSDTTQATGTTEAGGATSGAAVTTASTDLGDVLVDADGMTLYAFTNDTGGVPTCTDACAGTWPAATVDSDQLPEGLDAAIFSVVEGAGGGFQLAANDQPLYRFSGDAAPGDTNGQGVGGLWFAVGPDGQMIQDAGGADTGGSGGATTMPPATDDDGGGYDDDTGGY
jgi:predicted lipoprotein with Yx(FWY)xxD motif